MPVRTFWPERYWLQERQGAFVCWKLLNSRKFCLAWKANGGRWKQPLMLDHDAVEEIPMVPTLRRTR